MQPNNWKLLCSISLFSTLASTFTVKSTSPEESSKVSSRESKAFRLFPPRYPGHFRAPVIYPINFLGNGRPTKIFVNNKELRPTIKPFTTASTTTTTTTTTAKPAVVESSSKPAPLRPQNSPVTWLGHYPFNGIPSSLFYYPSGKLPVSSPITWINPAPYVRSRPTYTNQINRPAYTNQISPAHTTQIKYNRRASVPIYIG